MKPFLRSLLIMGLLTTQGLTQEQVGGSQPIIKEIQFEGNQVFPDGELLRALQLTKLGDPYIPDKFEYDLHVNVGARYRNNGYINMRADTPRIEVIGETGARQPLCRIVVPVQEGSQFVYGSFEVEGVKKFSVDEVTRIFPMLPGGVINYGALRAHSEITPYFRAQFSQNSSGIARGLDFLIDANPLWISDFHESHRRASWYGHGQ